jgi:WD40-like Beta Propeller Repeat
VARFAPALVLLPVAALAAAGCGGGKATSAGHAASLSVSCSQLADASASSNLLWQGGSRPLVYYVDRGKVVSSHGPSRSLPASAIIVGFRACAKPLLLYTVGTALRATALVGGGKTLTVGRNAVVAPNGRLVSYTGSKIGYAGGSSFAVRGLPLHWRITSIAVSPRDPNVFLAAAQSPEAGIESCGKGMGAIYRITPSGSKTIFVDNPCRDHPQAAFSPDGSTISYVGGSSAALYTLDSSAAHLQRVTTAGNVTRYLWSPDGTKIAFVTKSGVVTVLSLKSGAAHQLGRGAPLAWSPDGREVALAAAGKPVVEAVSASGGSHRVLLHLPKS